MVILNFTDKKNVFDEEGLKEVELRNRSINIDDVYGRSIIEKVSNQRVEKMIELLWEYGIKIESKDKNNRRFELIDKINSLDLYQLEKINKFINREVLECKENRIHLHRYKYKLDLEKLIARVYKDKLSEIKLQKEKR